MKKLTKKIFSICITSVVLFCIAGCSDMLPAQLKEYDYKTPGPAATTTPDPKKTETIETNKYCGEFIEQKRNDLFEYSVCSSGIQIDGFVENCETEELVIPSEIGGVNVVGIAFEAFCDVDKITEVTIPGTVKYIGNSAFRRCKNIERVFLSAGLEFVGGHSFDSCVALRELTFPETVTYIGGYACSLSGVENISIPKNMNVVPRGMYYGSAVKDFILPVYVTHIGESSFAKCPGLVDITVPGSVVYIGNTALANNVNMKRVVIEEGCKELEYGVFEGAVHLEEVYLPKSVEQFSSSMFPDANPDLVMYVKEGSKIEEFAISKKLKHITVE